ncbi:hypothetical protein PPO43_04675 [Saprospira sp. CCB-QB6]|uniref:hypothetical protein n=1 Tax=Saprospira sp. CCB-QB6 TaxID=3023936 RepID=UPI002349336D|nr:hypothetical protein [Saprospira sp. CCB-QB6]WCL82393.1 hypothetical protein PPO43_04675 [Saprospira sp. CCB-QB6]
MLYKNGRFPKLENGHFILRTTGSPKAKDLTGAACTGPIEQQAATTRPKKEAIPF